MSVGYSKNSRLEKCQVQAENISDKLLCEFFGNNVSMFLEFAFISCHHYFRMKRSEFYYSENTKEYGEFCNIHLFNKNLLKAAFFLYNFLSNLSNFSI